MVKIIVPLVFLALSPGSLDASCHRATECPKSLAEALSSGMKINATLLFDPNADLVISNRPEFHYGRDEIRRALEDHYRDARVTAGAIHTWPWNQADPAAPRRREDPPEPSRVDGWPERRDLTFLNWTFEVTKGGEPYVQFCTAILQAKPLDREVARVFHMDEKEAKEHRQEWVLRSVRIFRAPAPVTTR